MTAGMAGYETEARAAVTAGWTSDDMSGADWKMVCPGHKLSIGGSTMLEIRIVAGPSRLADGVVFRSNASSWLLERGGANCECSARTREE